MPSRVLIALLFATLCAVPAAGALLAASDGDPGQRTIAAEAAEPAGAVPAASRTRPRPIRRPFAPTSFWNAPLADDAALDDRSSAYVGRLQTLLRRWEPYVNTTRYSTPVYIVPRKQRTVRVKLDKPDSEDLQAAMDKVPLPPDARPARGTDAHLTVWQPSTDTLWEFWRAYRGLDGWHTSYGGRMTDVSENPGHFTEHRRWGATATSLPLLGGLMRIRELRQGKIDHALAIALPEVRANAFSWPAQRTDGSSRHVNAIPQGARFRIDPSLDLSKLEMSPIVRMMATAAQRYGIVVRDGAGAVTFYGEDPTPTGRNPYRGRNGFFGGGHINEMLRREFPWQHLEVLRTRMTYLGPPPLLGG